MANDGESSARPVPMEASGQSQAEPLHEPTTSSTASSLLPTATLSEDRNALLDRARVFLTSPQIVREEPAAKRRFLAEKGLIEGEIEGLMRELRPQMPVVPPRTYPQPPPSNLPYLLLGLTKILMWLTGSSVVLVFVYYRFLLPRLTRSALARRSLKQHQVSLLTRLNASLASLRSTRTEAFAVLPPPSTAQDPSELAQKRSLEDLNIDSDAAIDIPGFTLLRCAIEGLSAEGKKATRDELFSLLEEKYSWLTSEKGAEFENSLWETLTNNTCFSEVDENGRLVWTYTPISPPSTSTPLMESLCSLKSSLPPPGTQRASPYQRTLETLTDFTGYITTQTYQLASSALRIHGIGLGVATPLGQQREEIRKEIRALKGLVLNRRTFAPTTGRLPFSTSPIQTS